MSAPLTFSVIIPTYNRAAALQRCLNSLLDQTYTNFEVIICDDGSTDNTQEIALTFNDHLNIKMDYAKNWGGPALPRNRGIELARGEYVCFLDSDDWWKANKLEELKNNISSNFNIYYHPLMIVNSERELKTIRCRRVNNKDPKLDLLINLNALPTSSVCVRNSLLKKSGGFSLNRELIGLEDYKFWIDLGGIGGRFKRIDECLGYYYIGESDSITLEDERQISRFRALYTEYINDPELVKFKGKIEASLNFNTGRVIQDAKLNKSHRKYLFTVLLKGSARLKLMAIKRLMKF